MQFVMSDSNQKGGLSLLLFHCFFNKSESITRFMHDIDLELYRSLPNLYAVCIAEASKKHKKLTAGFFIKTTYTHHDSDFVVALNNAVSTDPRLKSLINEHSSFLPARLNIAGDTPPSETEMLRVMMTQALKHSVAGTA